MCANAAMLRPAVSPGSSSADWHRQAQRLGVVLAGELRQVPLRAHGRLPGVQALRILASRALHLRNEHLRRDDADDVARDLVLKDEQVGQLAIVFLRPEVSAGGGVDELGRDANAVRGAAHAAFENVANAELASDRPNVDRLAFEREAGIARNDEQRADARERGDEVFDNAVGEELLLRARALMLAKGRTAIEGLCGSDRSITPDAPAGPAAALPSSVTAKARTGWSMFLTRCSP